MLSLQPSRIRKKNNERARKHQIGNAAPPPAPRAVAGGADNRIDDEIQQRRKTPDQKPDRKIVGIVVFQHQRKQGRSQGLHHPEAEITPEHPDEESNQGCFCVRECSDSVEIRRRGLRGRQFLIHNSHPFRSKKQAVLLKKLLFPFFYF